MGINIGNIIYFLNQLPTIVMLGVEVMFCLLAITLVFKFGRLLGVYIYVAVATLCANIAVVKTAFFPGYGADIALGTGIFTSVFLCNDIINEVYGRQKAMHAIFIGFFSHLLFLMLLLIVMGYTPSADTLGAHNAMVALLAPAPAIFISSVVAYFSSQYLDLIVYRGLRTVFKDRWLSLRSFISTAIGSFVDNVIFSVLAWYVLSPTPLSFSTIWWTYIWGIYLMRLVISFIMSAWMPILNRLRPHHDQSIS